MTNSTDSHSIQELLEDSITKDLLEDPINLPCCGNAISRQSLIDHFDYSDEKNCPICRGDLDDFDPSTAPKAINLNYILDKLKNQSVIEIPKVVVEVPKFVAKLYPIQDPNYRTKIAKLEITSTELIFKTLIIPVIDLSGSMSGNPVKQAKYSLSRIVDLTFNNSTNLTSIVTYNDSHKIIEVDTNKFSRAFYLNTIDQMNSGGGTSFFSAFEGICNVIGKYKDQRDISNIVIIFLTDGEDSKVNMKGRITLVTQLKENILKQTDKPTTIHTVGFGSQHDYDFLNNLRTVCLEGCYKYANPSEDLDSLSNKINSIIDVIMNNNYIPIKLIDNLNIIHDYKDNSYFIDITKNIINSVKIKVDNVEAVIEVPIDLQPINQINIKNSWYNYLIDQVAQETLSLLTKQPSSQMEAAQQVDMNLLDNKLHIELLEKRCKAIMIRINNSEDTNNNLDRITKLLDMINNIKKNIKIDKLKLSDMTFEGKFATSNSKNNITVTSSQSNNYSNSPISPTSVMIQKSANKLEYIDKRSILYYDPNDGILNKIYHGKTQDTINDINKNIIDINSQNKIGSNLLIMAASVGRIDLVRYLLNQNKLDINYKNTLGYSALDYAIVAGFWITTKILIDNKAITSASSELLFTTCIHSNYFNTAKVLLDNKLACCTSSHLNYVLTQKQLNFVNSNNTGEVNIETAIIKGLYDKVTNSTIQKVSWKLFLPILQNLTDDHYKIIEYLISEKKLDPNEIIYTSSNNELVSPKVWPLFLACEKGITTLYNFLINHINLETINQRNEKGTTVLWIASCNKHIDIVSDLLNRGADPNICNLKGDSPLIACIQKGACVIVELLLEYGADINLNNINRDNCVLIACRNGQSTILDILLSKMNDETRQKYLYTYAEIDGFSPLLASTELDRVSCIKVLHKYGVNMETRSEDNNKILSGATALHLACHYNRIEALKCLVKLGSDLKAQTSTEGLTCLHIAIKQGHNNITRYLLNLPKDQGRECLKICDNQGKTPEYYAHSAGNEEILEEFFNDTLTNCLCDVINTSKINTDITKKCANKINQFGQSLTCYEYSDIMDINLGVEKFSTYALLTDNIDLINVVDDKIINNNLLTNNESISNNEINIQDSYVINKDYEFWKCLVSKKNSSDPIVTEQLERIKKIQSNVQNRILLDIKNINKLIMSRNEEQMDQNTKMNNGFSLSVSNDVLDKLRKSNIVSLLGFFEKIKDKKSLDYLMSEAKIFTINKIRNGCNLSVLHLIVLYLYSGHLEIYNQVNSALTNWNLKNIFCPFTECLYQAIKSLDIYEGEVYRAVNTSYNSNKYAIDNLITWNTFSTCSYIWNSANEQVMKKRGMIFVIKNRTGRLLAPYSKYGANAEVVFLPGTSFKVTNHYKSSIICLGQANIRGSTFKITENDYNKINVEQDAIIIELEEIEEIV